MFKSLFFLIKVGVFAMVILVLGNLIRWDGKSLSDQIKTQMSSAQNSEVYKSVTEHAKNFSEDVKNKVVEKAKDAGEEISQTERAKLRKLIKELNRSAQKE